MPGSIPSKVDVVIIGAGIMGLATAYFLSSEGLSVLVLEKNLIASQQSSRNWGFIRTQDRDFSEIPLSLHAQILWEEFSKTSPTDFNWRRRGCLYAANDQNQMTHFEKWAHEASDHGVETKVLSASEFRRLAPLVAQTPLGGMWTASDTQADPEKACASLAFKAKAAGASIVEGIGAVSIDIAAGSVCGIETEKGYVATSTVVVAAGATSHRLLRTVGINIPQQTVRNSVALTQPLPELLEPCFCGFGIGLRQRLDGSCIITDEALCDIDLTLDSFRNFSAFVPSFKQNRKSFSIHVGRPLMEDVGRLLSGQQRHSAVQPRNPHIPPNLKRLEGARKRMQELFPTAPKIELSKQWAGMIDVTPDALPIIERHPDVTGIIVATGFSGHGFGLGPAVGDIVADLVLGKTPKVNISAFKSGRFRDGSKPTSAGTI
jgi:glycine/D-amino acid oxidase-like deaminating enzyme